MGHNEDLSKWGCDCDISYWIREKVLNTIYVKISFNHVNMLSCESPLGLEQTICTRESGLLLMVSRLILDVDVNPCLFGLTIGVYLFGLTII